MPELPLELCQMIVEEIDNRSDLLSLLLVSINFNSAIERYLYHSLSFSSQRPGLDIIKMKRIFETISSCPRVASHVHHLSIELIWFLPSTSTSNLAEVFQSVPNLKSLRLRPSYDVRTGFQAQVPFLLHTFAYSGIQQWYPPSFTRTLEDFLEAQVELKELFFTSDEDITLTPSALPRLTTVFGNGKFIRAILPGRSVTRVATCGEDEPLPFPRSRIRSFCINALNADLRWYTTLFPTLTYLQYEVRNFQDTRLMPYLKWLPVLEKLRVITGGRKWTDNEESGFVNSIFVGCPSLRCIETYHALYIGTYHTALFDEPYKLMSSITWTRGSETGTKTVLELHEWTKK